MRRTCVLTALVCLTACGSKSGLTVPAYGPADAGEDGGTDAGADAGVDGGHDAGVDAGPSVPCVDAPLGGAPQVFELGFEARITAADLVFLVDTTGSMGSLIAEIEDTLQSRLIPGLSALVPNLQMAVASYRDFGFRPYGDFGDEPYELLQGSTADVALLQRAVERMHARGGGDQPESGVEALYQIATGEGLAGYVERTRCEGDGRGGACLRPDAVPIVLVFTDAPFHNGPTLGETYATVRPRPHTYAQTIDALNAGGYRVLGMSVLGGLTGRPTREDLEATARDTGAVTSSGEPLVLDLGADSGRPLVSRMVDAFERLVEDTPIDVDAVVEDADAGDRVDATRFVERIVPASATPASGARVEGERFVDVEPGTRVRFRIEVRNRFLRPTSRRQAFGLRVTLREDGVAPLRSRVFEVVVPAEGGPGCDR